MSEDNNNLVAILTVGISASGKSTWAEKKIREGGFLVCPLDYSSKIPKWVEVNRDKARATLFPGLALKEQMRPNWDKYRFTKDRERRVTDYCNDLIKNAYDHGQNIIVSDTNLNSNTRENLKTFFEGYDYEVLIEEFPISLDEAYKRDSMRLGGVGQGVIYKQYLRWLDYKESWKYNPNQRLRKAIVFDIDGTLALMNGKRGPYQWDQVLLDSPRYEIIDMLLGYQNKGYNIIIASGRDGSCEKLTRMWLDKYKIPYDDFYIRKAGDMSKDYVVKENILLDMAKKWNIVAWVDDRPQVHRHLRLLGVNMVCVGDPYNEF